MIIHVKYGDSTRRTNTVVQTFASLLPPKHITAGYLRVLVEPYIPNPLRCFECQKYGHRSKTCKNAAICAKCGEAGHEGMSCGNHQKCANCKGGHSTSSPDCPKWKLKKRVQQLKEERDISFPDATKAALSEQPTNAPRQTAASLVSTAVSSTIQSKREQTATETVQTELTSPVGTYTPVPVKVNSQSTQTTGQ